MLYRTIQGHTSFYLSFFVKRCIVSLKLKKNQANKEITSSSLRSLYYGEFSLEYHQEKLFS